MSDTVKKGSVLEEEEPWSFETISHRAYGLVAGAGVVAGAVPPAGAVPVAGVAGVSGMALLALGDAGAVTGAGVNAWSSTDEGARCCVDIRDSTKARKRKIPPPHQLVLVSRLPACRVPMSESDELLTPPKLADMPSPLPL